MTFLTNLDITLILCSLRLVLDGKVGKKIAESSKFKILEKFFANSVA